MKTWQDIFARLALTACLVCWVPWQADASGRVHPASAALLAGQVPGHEALFDWINLSLLIAALVYLLHKPLGGFFRERSAGIRKALEEGRSALERAHAQLAAMEEKTRGLEAQIVALKAEAARQTEAERERLSRATEQDAERILHVAQASIEIAVQAAKLELKAHAVREATDMAEKMVRERLDEAARARLVRRFLDGLHRSESRPPA